MGANDRSYTNGRFALDIDGVTVSFLKKFSGMAMEADIATHDHGPEIFQTKNVANIKWTAGKVSVGAGMGAGMYKWIKQSFDKAFVQKNGTLTNADFNYKAQSTLTFMNALITSVTFPKLDASSKEALYLDVEFEPEQVRWAKGGGESIQGKYGTKQKAWLCSNFRVEMGSLPCERVSTVDSFTWKQSIAPDPIGIHREPTKHPAKVTVPEIKLSISMADYEPWAKYARSWFVDGNHLQDQHMTGRISLLAPDTKKEIGEITLEGCGLKKFDEGDKEANSEKIARFNVELYVEHMTFKLTEYDA
jgi:hypothetical protein